MEVEDGTIGGFYDSRNRPMRSGFYSEGCFTGIKNIMYVNCKVLVGDFESGDERDKEYLAVESFTEKGMLLSRGESNGLYPVPGGRLNSLIGQSEKFARWVSIVEKKGRKQVKKKVRKKA
tara:strand:- start:2155 stop:2514 length:360 start_codon:yes stop_codon:yes gene_type:complete